MSADKKERILELPDKDSRFYKLMDRFLTDDQKEDLLITLLINAMWIAFHIPIIRDMIRDEAMEGGYWFKCVTQNNVCFLGFDKGGGTLEILYKPRKLLGRWKELELPEDLEKMLSPYMSKANFKKTVNAIMNMKAFL